MPCHPLRPEAGKTHRVDARANRARGLKTPLLSLALAAAYR